jgi:hypothetical protein
MNFFILTSVFRCRKAIALCPGRSPYHYMTSVLDRTLDHTEQRQMGLPWSEHLVQRTLHTTGGAHQNSFR